MTAAAALAEISRLGVVPVATIDDEDAAVGVGTALLEGGLPCIEVTLRTAAGLPAIAALAHGAPELLVGAGTVLSVDDAAAAIEAGAHFLASPGFDDEVVAWCRARDVLVLPGVLTPTEMLRARRSGLDAVKFFPAASAGGPSAIAAVAAVFPGLRFVPTGGIGPDDAADYLRNRAVAAVGGSWIVDRGLVASGDFAAVATRAAEAVRTAAAARPVAS